jgi:hypothetical protein
LKSVLKNYSSLNEQILKRSIEEIPRYLRNTRDYEAHIAVDKSKWIAEGRDYWNLVFLAEKLFRLSVFFSLSSLKQNHRNELIQCSFFLDSVREMLGIQSYDNSNLNQDLRNISDNQVINDR